MTITPEQARELLDGARPGPWYVHTVPDDPDGTFIYDDMGHMCIAVEPAGSDYLEADLPLAAAAPDLAEAIASMTEEWGVNIDGTVTWMNDRDMAEDAIGGIGTGHLVRRLVGPVEVIDGE